MRGLRDATVSESLRRSLSLKGSASSRDGEEHTHSYSVTVPWEWQTCHDGSAQQKPLNQGAQRRFQGEIDTKLNRKQASADIGEGHIHLTTVKEAQIVHEWLSSAGICNSGRWAKTGWFRHWQPKSWAIETKQIRHSREHRRGLMHRKAAEGPKSSRALRRGWQNEMLEFN